jgi:hypothetical protein
MSSRLVTIATFQDPVAAAMARNFLESEGIQACLIDESTVATDWLISTAIGGIKLQVESMQVERAEMLLAQSRDENTPDEQPTPQTAIAAEDAAEELRQENEDKAPINILTDRLFRCSVFGLLFLPLQLYTLYLLASILGADGKVSPKRRWKIWVSMALNYPLLAVVGIPLLWMFDVWSAPQGTPENPVWQRRLIADGRISVKMPHEPHFTWGKAIGQFGAVQSQSWTGWSQGRVYRVTVDSDVNFPANLTSDQVLQAVTRDRLLNGRGVMREEAALESRDPPGRAFWITFPDYDERGRVYLRGNGLLYVYAQGSPQEVQGAEAEQFLKSFRLR